MGMQKRRERRPPRTTPTSDGPGRNFALILGFAFSEHLVWSGVEDSDRVPAGWKSLRWPDGAKQELEPAYERSN